MVPATEENETGLPFVGRAGKLLDSILEKAGLDYGSVYITNLVKCFLAAGKPLEQSWIDACFPYLVNQIFLLRPIYIITLGKDASSTLLGCKKAEVKNGLLVEYAEGISIMPTYHPSYLLRGGGEKHIKFEEVVDNFKKIKNKSIKEVSYELKK